MKKISFYLFVLFAYMFVHVRASARTENKYQVQWFGPGIKYNYRNNKAGHGSLFGLWSPFPVFFARDALHNLFPEKNLFLTTVW